MALIATADRPETRRDVTINVRATQQVRDLIDRAAAVIGKTRSEFMLDSARSRAEHVLLAQTLFPLGDRAYAEFVRALDNPPPANAALRELLSHKAPWVK